MLPSWLLVQVLFILPVSVEKVGLMIGDLKLAAWCNLSADSCFQRDLPEFLPVFGPGVLPWELLVEKVGGILELNHILYWHPFLDSLWHSITVRSPHRADSRIVGQ